MWPHFNTDSGVEGGQTSRTSCCGDLENLTFFRAIFLPSTVPVRLSNGGTEWDKDMHDVSFWRHAHATMMMLLRGQSSASGLGADLDSHRRSPRVLQQELREATSALGVLWHPPMWRQRPRPSARLEALHHGLVQASHPLQVLGPHAQWCPRSVEHRRHVAVLDRSGARHPDRELLTHHHLEQILKCADLRLP